MAHGAVAVGATIYFGSAESRRQLVEIARAFARAHELGMATILWCYLRNGAFRKEGIDYHTAADLTGQADHLGATIEADIVKQKLPTLNGGFTALASARARPPCTTVWPPTIRSTSAATRSPTATWGVWD